MFSSDFEHIENTDRPCIPNRLIFCGWCHVDQVIKHSSDVKERDREGMGMCNIFQDVKPAGQNTDTYFTEDTDPAFLNRQLQQLNHCTKTNPSAKMRFLQLLQASLFAITVLASSDDSNARFNKYLTKSISATGSLKLDDSKFEDLTKSPRDYYVATLLTAMPAQFGCVLCKAFQPEFDILAKSWINGDRKGNSKLLFGTLDFLDGKGTFQKVRIKVCLAERIKGVN